MARSRLDRRSLRRTTTSKLHDRHRDGLFSCARPRRSTSRASPAAGNARASWTIGISGDKQVTRYPGHLRATRARSREQFVQRRFQHDRQPLLPQSISRRFRVHAMSWLSAIETAKHTMDQPDASDFSIQLIMDRRGQPLLTCLSSDNATNRDGSIHLQTSMLGGRWRLLGRSWELCQLAGLRRLDQRTLGCGQDDGKTERASRFTWSAGKPCFRPVFARSGR